MTKIICISGRQSDLNERIALMLKGELMSKSKQVLVTRFSDPLKHICQAWYGWDGQEDAAGRAMLQYMTGYTRAQCPNFWVDYTLGLLSMMGDDWDYVIIPDFDFPNKQDMAQHGFQVWHIRVEDSPNSAWKGSSENTAAPDYMICSEKAFVEMRKTAEEIVQEITA